MRVITGSARGKKLFSPEGLETRPTSDMVKESIFSIIQFDVAGASVLDLFAGSGQLGIEALSRGAEHCVFVDENIKAIEIVKQNLNHTGFMSKSRVVRMDSIDFLKCAKKGIDIALLDPPYNMGILQKALPLVENIMSENGIVVCEHEAKLELPQEVGRLQKAKSYRYGKIELTVYRTPDTDTEEE